MSIFMTITVCIATYNRNNLLSILLDSLEKQSWLLFGDLQIIVVDNDPAGRARQLIQNRAEKSPCNLRYHHEPTKGISAARNAALKMVCTPFFAFIDDDEFAEPAWLKTLYDTAITYRADVVFGPVKSLFGKNAPEWLETLDMHQPPTWPTGTLVKYGATNNVLINTFAVRSRGITFSNDFGVTGGEDTGFFHRLDQEGCRMVWCESAWVSELVDPHRYKTKWLILRGFRGGQTFARVFVDPKDYVERASRALTRGGCALVVLLALPFILPFSRRRAMNYTIKASGWVGQVTVVLGMPAHYQEYK